jgi:hypothetical protein
MCHKGTFAIRYISVSDPADYFLANCCRRKKLDVIRRQLPDIIEQKVNEKTNSPTTCRPCPNCKVGVLLLMSIALLILMSSGYQVVKIIV